MSPRTLWALTMIRRDMKVSPRAFTSKYPMQYFARYKDIREVLVTHPIPEAI